MAVLAIALGLMADDEPSASTVRDLVAVAFAASLVAALVVSWQRRKVGVAKQRERAQVSSARIIEMTGIDRQAQTFADGPEFPPVLDIAAAAGPSVFFTKRAMNRTYEIMGMRDALRASLDIDVILNATPSAEKAEFGRIRKEQGLKAALAWRDSRFSDGS